MIKIDEKLAKSLIDEQFPEYKNLKIKSVPKSGWDNRMFILGKNEFLIRMPSGPDYASKIEKEYNFLPKFKNFLSFSIPEPVALGKPNSDFPYPWSIYKYIEGENLSAKNIENMSEFAKDLAKFLNEFQKIDTKNGPEAGEHNFYRGGNLKIYDNEVQESLKLLKDKINIKSASKIWEKAIKISWNKEPVWVHGDISLGNALFQNGKLHAVIDFGGMGVGDPACDLAIAWTDFDKQARQIFHNSLENIDKDTWNRGRAWALWKALILASGFCDGPEEEKRKSQSIVENIINDYCSYP